MAILELHYIHEFPVPWCSVPCVGTIITQQGGDNLPCALLARDTAALLDVYLLLNTLSLSSLLGTH